MRPAVIDVVVATRDSRELVLECVERLQLAVARARDCRRQRLTGRHQLRPCARLAPRSTSSASSDRRDSRSPTTAAPRPEAPELILFLNDDVFATDDGDRGARSGARARGRRRWRRPGGSWIRWTVGRRRPTSPAVPGPGRRSLPRSSGAAAARAARRRRDRCRRPAAGRLPARSPRRLRGRRSLGRGLRVLVRGRRSRRVGSVPSETSSTFRRAAFPHVGGASARRLLASRGRRAELSRRARSMRRNT